MRLPYPASPTTVMQPEMFKSTLTPVSINVVQHCKVFVQLEKEILYRSTRISLTF